MTAQPLSPARPYAAVLDERFTSVYNQFAPRLIRYVSARFGRRDAEEIVQETFARAYQRLDLYRSPAETWGWLTLVAQRLAIDLSRSRRHCDSAIAPAEVSEPVDPAQAPDAAAISAEERAIVRAALRRLPSAQRQVIELYEFDSYSCPVIARMLSTPEPTVRKTLQRARLRLAREYRALGGQFPVIVAPLGAGAFALLRRAARGSRLLDSARRVTSRTAYAGTAVAAAAVLVVAAGGSSWLGGDGVRPPTVPSIAKAILEQSATVSLPGTASPSEATGGSGVTVAVPAAPRLSVPRTPMSPGQRSEHAVRIPTPVGTVVVDENLSVGPGDGVVCSAPGIDCS